MKPPDTVIMDRYFEFNRKYGPITMILYPSFLLAVKLDALLDWIWHTDDNDEWDEYGD